MRERGAIFMDSFANSITGLIIFSIVVAVSTAIGVDMAFALFGMGQGASSYIQGLTAPVG
ncbi:MAG: hypothetical protein OWT27_08515, partial [Firmicutes bacterium]|nr:hypothetical protein [Bacillota bacterium]